MNVAGTLGLGAFLIFFSLVAFLGWRGRKNPVALRELPAFGRLLHSIGLAVESGKRLHVSLGRGNFYDSQAASALVGLSILERIARSASVSDRPPVATSGDGLLAVLSQDSLRSTYRAIGAANQYDPNSAQMSGPTPFSYAAGVLPVLYDEQVSTTVFMGHFGSEVALITDAAERMGSFTLAGSDSLPAQAVFYAAAQEPLIGEELFAASAYLKSNPVNIASLQVQDIFRWLLIIAMFAGAALKFFELI